MQKIEIKDNQYILGNNKYSYDNFQLGRVEYSSLQIIIEATLFDYEYNPSMFNSILFKQNILYYGILKLV